MCRNITFLVGLLSMLVLGVLPGCSDSSSEKTANGAVFQRDTLTAEERVARQLTPEVLWKLGRLGQVALSPDATEVLYEVTYFSMQLNKGQTDIYLQSIAGGTAKQLVRDATSPAWVPGTKKIAYLHNGKLFYALPDGSSQQEVGSFQTPVECYWFSPQGDKLLYARRDTVVSKPYPALKSANVRVIDSLMYRHWNYWDDGCYLHLFLTDVSQGVLKEGKDLMPGEPWDAPLAPYFDPSEVSWSPDGSAIYYTCKKLQGRQYAVTTNANIYRYDLQRGQTESLTDDNPGYDRYPRLSPDGKYLAWQRMRTAGYESDRALLMRRDLETGEVLALTEAYDGNAESFGWMPDGKSLWMISGVKGTVQLFTVDAVTGALTQQTEGQFNVNWVAPLPQGWLINRTQMNRPAELYCVDKNDWKQLTTINDDIYKAIDWSQVRPRYIQTTDGSQMLTWVVLPPNFDSTKQYPAILYCEGGPQSTVSQFFSYRWNMQLMASQGYVVVCPNRHGLPSFGQAWNRQISGDYSGQNIQDYLVAIDTLAKEPWVDASRLGCVGASYGGYSVYYLAGVHNHRFKAFIAHNGMFNFESFYAATEETWFPNFDFGGPYWDKSNPVAMRSYANSPHKNVDKWDTPILIIVGEHDFRIPYTEGLQAFNAAQLRGVPSRLLVFPDETHFVSKPQNSLVWQHEFFNWLDRWLKK